MEPGSKVQHRPETIINQWLSETDGDGNEWVVSQRLDGHIIKCVVASSLEEARRIKQQWETSGDI